MKQDQNVNTPFREPYSDEEIDLMELVEILLRKKLLIFGLTLLVTGAGILYSVITPDVYEAKVNFSPPSTLAVASLQVDLPDFTFSYKPDQMFVKFGQSLQDMELRKGVWDELPSKNNEIRISFAEFNSSIAIQKKKDEERNRPEWLDPAESISFQGRDPVYASSALNMLIRKANFMAVESLIKEMTERLANYKEEKFLRKERRKREILAEISILRDRAEIERLAKIVRLEENLRVARKAGLRFPCVIRKDETGNAGLLLLSSQNLPFYMLGEQLLRAKLEELHQRKTNDPYIFELPGLQAELNLPENNDIAGGNGADQPLTEYNLQLMLIDQEIERLNSLLAESSLKIRAVTVDQPAFPPTSAQKPHRSKIVLLAFVAGLMLSIFSAFVVNFFERYDKRKREGDAYLQ